jgi:hypothetical protein
MLVHLPSVWGLIARLDASLPLSLIGEPGYAACIESLASRRDLNRIDGTLGPVKTKRPLT